MRDSAWTEYTALRVRKDSSDSGKRKNHLYALDGVLTMFRNEEGRAGWRDLRELCSVQP